MNDISFAEILKLGIKIILIGFIITGYFKLITFIAEVEV